MAQLLGRQHAQHVGLVLVAVDGAAQPAAGQPRVVAGRDGVEAERQRASGQRGELDLLVAAQARVGCLAAGVGRHEVVDHVLVEPVGEVPDVERDAEHVGDAAGVAGVLDRAAAARAGAQRAGRGDSARCTPATSWPASTIRAAATAESTPPLIAASTRIARLLPRWPGRPGAPARRRRAVPPARRPRRPRCWCGPARSAASRGRWPGRRPSRAARGTAGPPRPCTPNPSSTRCPWRPAASAASRPRSRGR